jgi:hypothetical protein
MSQLPSVMNATIDDAKIIQYLLNSAHSSAAAGKANFFMSFGFSQANWAELKKSLLEHPQTNQVTNQTTTAFGDKYVISCSLTTPDGRNPCVISVWIIESPDPNPKFVTAYPDP